MTQQFEDVDAFGYPRIETGMLLEEQITKKEVGRMTTYYPIGFGIYVEEYTIPIIFGCLFTIVILIGSLIK